MVAQCVLCEWLLFNDPVTYCSHIVLVTHERMDMHYWWNDTDTGELQYFEENLSQCRFVQYKSQMDRSRAYAVRGRRLPPEPWQCLICDAGNEITDFTFCIPPTAHAITVTQPNKYTQLYNIITITNCCMFLAVLSFSTSNISACCFM
jgi:hypothetical protein